MQSVERQQHSDTELSFETLYNLNFAKINRYLRYRVINTWDADDLTTLVFMKALDKFYSYRGQSSFSSWLFRIAHNVYVDYVRGYRELATDDDLLLQQVAVEDNPEQHILVSEEVDELRSMLNQLTPDYRDVMALRYVGELRFAQIADVLGKTEASVRMIHHRALKNLRQQMQRQG